MMLSTESSKAGPDARAGETRATATRAGRKNRRIGTFLGTGPGSAGPAGPEVRLLYNRVPDEPGAAPGGELKPRLVRLSLRPCDPCAAQIGG